MSFDLAVLTPLAATTVAAITPHLNALATKTLDAAGAALGKTAVDKLTGWISGSTASAADRAQEALQDLSKAPDNSDNAAALRVQLIKLLQEDTAFAQALQDWLKENKLQPQAGTVQTATASGRNSTVNQVSGSSNVTIHR